MKRFTYLFMVVALIAISFNSCTSEEDFDSSLLIGKWVSGTVHYKYNSGGTGSTWDTADDVKESEAQKFTWTLEGSELTQIHELEMTASTVLTEESKQHMLTRAAAIPKTYTVTKLTDTELAYKDNTTGKPYSFTKE